MMSPALPRCLGWWPVVHERIRPCGVSVCCNSHPLPSAVPQSCSSAVPSGGPTGSANARCAVVRESPSRPCSTPAGNRSAGRRQSFWHRCARSFSSRGTGVLIFGETQNATHVEERSISRIVCKRTLAPFVQSSQRVSSLGEWLIPLMLGTKIIPIGPIFAIIWAS
jgi:hypothetical protein